jgi:hypothetical protein
MCKIWYGGWCVHFINIDPGKIAPLFFETKILMKDGDMENKNGRDANYKEDLLINVIEFKDSKDRDYYENGWKEFISSIKNDFILCAALNILLIIFSLRVNVVFFLLLPVSILAMKFYYVGLKERLVMCKKDHNTFKAMIIWNIEFMILIYTRIMNMSCFVFFTLELICLTFCLLLMLNKIPNFVIRIYTIWLWVLGFLIIGCIGYGIILTVVCLIWHSFFYCMEVGASKSLNWKKFYDIASGNSSMGRAEIITIFMPFGALIIFDEAGKKALITSSQHGELCAIFLVLGFVMGINLIEDKIKLAENKILKKVHK